MDVLTIDQRIERAETAFNEGRIIQHSWRRSADEHGREFVCALAAFGPDTAAKVQPDPAPPYWQKVVDAIGQVQRALQGDGDLGEARAAAAARWAAAAAAYRQIAETLFALIDVELEIALPGRGTGGAGAAVG